MAETPPLTRGRRPRDEKDARLTPTQSRSAVFAFALLMFGATAAMFTAAARIRAISGFFYFVPGSRWCFAPPGPA